MMERTYAVRANTAGNSNRQKSYETSKNWRYKTIKTSAYETSKILNKARIYNWLKAD